MGSLFSGPKTTTTQNQNTQQQGTSNTQQTGITGNQATSLGQNTSTSSTTPNLPSWYNQFLAAIPGQYQSLASTLQSNVSHPLYGPQQQAAFQGNLNQNQAAAQKTLTSQQAANGSLNSARAGQEQTQLGLGGQQQLANYLAAAPQLNAAYQQQNLGQLQQAIQGQQGFTSPIAAGGTTTQSDSLNSLINQVLGYSSGTSAQQSQGTSSSQGVGTQQTNPNLLGGLLGGAAQAGLGLLMK